MLMLDTHALVWLTEGVDRLGQAARRHVEIAIGQDGAVLVSAISIWELGMLATKRRIEFSSSYDQWVDRLLTSARFRIAAIDAAIARRAGAFGDEIHRDPADRLLVAAAIEKDATLLTADGPILDFAAHGQLRAIDARL